MAITINQQPTGPLYSKGPVVFVVSSDNITETNFSFVVKVTVGSDTFEYRKQPNPTSRGVIDLGRIIDNNLNWDIGALGTTVVSTALPQVKSFSVVFEEDYDGVTDNAATTAVSLTAIKGFREFDSTDLTDEAYTADAVLSTITDTLKVRSGNRYIISWWDDSESMLIQTPLVAGASDFTQSIGGQTISFEVLPESSLGDRTFWWMDRKGGWDFFIATEEEEYSNNVERSVATASEITHGFTTSSNKEPANSKVYKSTSNLYNISYSRIYTKQSQWVSKQEALKLEGLFDSPLVFLEEGDLFRPVQMQNNSYDGYPVRRRNELFQYDLQWNYSNDKRQLK